MGLRLASEVKVDSVCKTHSILLTTSRSLSV